MMETPKFNPEDHIHPVLKNESDVKKWTRDNPDIRVYGVYFRINPSIPKKFKAGKRKKYYDFWYFF